MKACKNCRNNLNKVPAQSSFKSRTKKHTKQTASLTKIQTEYGLAKVISQPKIVLCNDEYMLQFMLKTEHKTSKLAKEVKKLKSRIQQIEGTLESNTSSYKQISADREGRAQRNSHVLQVNIRNDYCQGQNVGNLMEAIVADRGKSRLSSINDSKNREVGRFTRVSQDQSRSFSKNSLKQIFHEGSKARAKRTEGLFNSNKSDSQKPEFVSFSNQMSHEQKFMYNSQKQTDKHSQSAKESKQSGQNARKRSKNKDFIQFNIKKSAPKQIEANNKSKVQSDDQDFEKYLPSYQQVESSISSNLLQQNQSQQLKLQKDRLQRQFDELIIKEKSVGDQDRRAIRHEIKALAQMLSNLNQE